MPQPTEKPIAFRPSPELRARFEAYAKAHNMNVNKAAQALIRFGLDSLNSVQASSQNSLAALVQDSARRAIVGSANQQAEALAKRDAENAARWRMLRPTPKAK